jgi:Spy/CpxP family protein refolding chaperone
MNRLIRNPRALVLLCLLLLVSNIALVAYIMAGKRSGRGLRGGNSIEERVRKEVGFTEGQSKLFHQLMEENRGLIQAMGDSARTEKRRFYGLLFRDSIDDAEVSQAATVLSERQRTIDLQLFRHFQKVRALCDARQRIKYDSIILRVTSRSGGSRGRGREEK